MEDRANPRNAFVALCELAGRERWCWDLMCTTCGHQNFRHALRALARGGHPDAADWRVRDHGRPGMLPASLGPPPHQFPSSEQKRIVSVCADADLHEIARLAPFPDWLGYLGIVLRYTEGVEFGDGVLTQAWAPQLAWWPGVGEPLREFLGTLRPTGEGILTWHDLGRVEGELRRVGERPD